jgi:hypothetical protein
MLDGMSHCDSAWGQQPLPCNGMLLSHLIKDDAVLQQMIVTHTHSSSSSSSANG